MSFLSNFFLITGFMNPKIKEIPVVDTIFGHEIIDKFKYLEDLENPDTKNFIVEQNKRFSNYINSIKGKEKLRKEIESLILKEYISLPFKKGNNYFFYRRYKENHYVLYYSKEKFDLENRSVAINPNKFSKDGTVSLDFAYVSNNGNLIAFGKSKGGDENSSLFVLDLKKKKLLKDKLEDVKWVSLEWSNDDKGFYYTRNEKKDGFKPVLYYHRLGDEQEKDEYILGKDLPDGKFIGIGSSSDRNYLILSINEWIKDDVYYKKEGDKEFKPLFVGKEGNFQVDIIKDKVIFLTTYKTPEGSIYITPIDNTSEEKWKLVFNSKNEIIVHFEICGGKIVLLTKEDTYSRIRIFNIDGEFENEIELPDKGSSRFSGSFDSDTLFLSFESFVHPRSIFIYNLKTKHMEKIWGEDYGDLNIEQEFLFVKAKDGKNIPVYIIHKKGIKKDRKNPTWLTGYGGFSAGISPYFSPTIIPWLNRGGVYAVAGIRGGNEYGEEWHRDGMRDKKINVFNDFIAVSEYLNETYSSPEFLCISGGSNGGLLMGGVITLKPEIYKCVICSNPLLDMINYHKFSVGYIWKTEYGDPEKEEDFRFLISYSPYHNIRDDTEYPVILFRTSENDTRVHPAHALKMAARLMNINRNPVYLYVERKTGHGAGRPLKMSVEHIVQNMLFMMDNTGIKVE